MLLTTIKNELLGTSPHRRSRFHNKKGQIINPILLIRHGILSVLSYIFRLINHQLVMPWLTFESQRRIEQFLRTKPNAVCLEYGSGMSTLWLAARCRQVYSVEDSPLWYEWVRRLLNTYGYKNVVYELRRNKQDFINFPSPDQRFDFILVDGSYRSETVEKALKHLKPGGLLYLDDTDRAGYDPKIQRAVEILEAYAVEHGQLNYLTDFVAHEVIVREGGLFIENAERFMQEKDMMMNLGNGQTCSPLTRLYYESHHLKQLYRQGWLRANISEQQCESVADHEFGVIFLTWLLTAQYPQLNRLKAMEMALLHDLCEVYAGDFMPHVIGSTEKYQREREAMEILFNKLPGGERYVELWEEYQQGESAEAKLLHQIDRLELGLQAVIYARQHTAFSPDGFLERADTGITDSLLKGILHEAAYDLGKSKIK